MMDEINQETGEIMAVHMTHSIQIGAIGQALAKAQTVIDNVLKEARNPHFNSKYADLGAILTEARPKVAACDIAIVQSPYNEGGDIGIETMLIHKSGEWIKGRLAVKPMKFDAQGAGSVITYLRRYSLASMLGIGSEDDDGEAAVGRPAVKTIAPSVWGGPLSKTDFKGAVRKFAGALADCNTARDLEDTLAEYEDLIKQMKTDKPDWWSGESDANGGQPFETRIEETKKRVGRTDFTRAE